MKKQVILIGIEARDELARGAEKLANAVSSTLGPYGQNFFLDKGKRPTNDGVTIAREFQLMDEIQNLGVGAIREPAIKTDEEVGDGTTTAITLAWNIFKDVSRLLSKEGVVGKRRPADIIRQIEKEREEVTGKLMAMKEEITTKEQLINSAIVAVEDKEMGKLIGTAQWELGKGGFLLAEETIDRKSSVEKISGIRIDNGFGTSQIINNQEKQTLEIEDARTILTSMTIKTLSEWQHVMRIYDSLVKNGGKNLVIVARAWTDETINWALQNINKGACIYPLSAPYIDMQERMKDLRAVLGGVFYDSENSTMDDLNFSGMGFARRIIARRHDAILTGMNDVLSQVSITARVEELKKKMSGTISDFEKKGLEERISQLENGFALIKVGSSSDMERKRLYDKCVDAVNAVRAAYQEGTVKGGGLAFKEIAETLSDNYLLKRPLLSIYEQIMSLAPSDFVVEEWVRDPVKVLRIALERACSAAGSLAMAGGAIAQREPKELDELLGRFRQK